MKTSPETIDVIARALERILAETIEDVADATHQDFERVAKALLADDEVTEALDASDTEVAYREGFTAGRESGFRDGYMTAGGDNP